METCVKWANNFIDVKEYVMTRKWTVIKHSESTRHKHITLAGFCAQIHVVSRVSGV